MRTLQIASGLALALALSACNTPAPRASTQMTPASGGASASMPQTSNSLPAGDTVNAPRASSTGVVGTTRP